MSWWEWRSIVLTALLVALVAAWLWVVRYDRRRWEQRLNDWRRAEFPEPPEPFPEPGTARLDSELESRLRRSDEFDGLRDFFRAYFHQDWDLDHEDEDDVIRNYVAEAHPSGVAELLCEMDTLLALGLSDYDLREGLVDAVGIEYLPPIETSAWLRTWRTMVFRFASARRQLSA